jgi:hypothetical protein
MVGFCRHLYGATSSFYVTTSVGGIALKSAGYMNKDATNDSNSSVNCAVSNVGVSSVNCAASFKCTASEKQRANKKCMQQSTI